MNRTLAWICAAGTLTAVAVVISRLAAAAASETDRSEDVYDEVTEASLDSFPASDPPSFSPSIGKH